MTLVRMAMRRLIMVALLGALACLRTLAYADPPDPTWIAGFWDDADFDDVVILITSTSVVAETHSLCTLERYFRLAQAQRSDCTSPGVPRSPEPLPYRGR